MRFSHKYFKGAWFMRNSNSQHLVLLFVLAVLCLPGCMIAEKTKLTDNKKAAIIETRVTAGIEAMRAKIPERARKHFSRALEIDPDSAEANNAMALLYRYELDKQREEEYYKRALRADKNFAPANNNYAVFLVSQNKTQKAIKYFQRAVDDEHYTRRSEAYANLGRSYLFMGDFAQAEFNVNKSMRLNARAAKPALLMAKILYKKENYKSAHRYLAQYKSLTKKQSASALVLGVRVAQKLDDKEAQHSLLFALERLYPQSAELKALQEESSKSTPVLSQPTSKEVPQ